MLAHQQWMHSDRNTVLNGEMHPPSQMRPMFIGVTCKENKEDRPPDTLSASLFQFIESLEHRPYPANSQERAQVQLTPKWLVDVNNTFKNTKLSIMPGHNSTNLSPPKLGGRGKRIRSPRHVGYIPSLRPFWAAWGPATTHKPSSISIPLMDGINMPNIYMLVG